jgi:hypothetical protein
MMNELGISAVIAQIPILGFLIAPSPNTMSDAGHASVSNPGCNDRSRIHLSITKAYYRKEALRFTESTSFELRMMVWWFE